MNVNPLIYFLLIVCILPQGVSGQPTHTNFKIGLETGAINTSELGNGLLLRPFVKFDAYKKFTRSILQFKTNVSSEVLDVQDRIAGVHLFTKLRYQINFGGKKLLINGSVRNQRHFFERSEKQILNDLQEGVQYSQRISGKYGFALKQWFQFREQSGVGTARLSKNSLQADFEINNASHGYWNAGFFLEQIKYIFLKNTKNQYVRYGPGLEFNYKKLLLFNVLYKNGIYKDRRAHDHQFTILTGKYLTKDISLFLFAYYLWRSAGAQKSNRLVTGLLESYNNISVKLSYDMQKKSQVFIRFLYDKQEIFEGREPLATFQGLLGIQKSF